MNLCITIIFCGKPQVGRVAVVDWSGITWRDFGTFGEIQKIPTNYAQLINSEFCVN